VATSQTPQTEQAPQTEQTGPTHTVIIGVNVYPLGPDGDRSDYDTSLSFSRRHDIRVGDAGRLERTMLFTAQDLGRNLQLYADGQWPDVRTTLVDRLRAAGTGALYLDNQLQVWRKDIRGAVTSVDNPTHVHPSLADLQLLHGAVQLLVPLPLP
jgi:hypothetical protein